MKELNLGFLCKDGEVLLAMKKRGFGAGKWNGYGGKLKSGESVEDALVREVMEEGGVEVKKEDLQNFGYLDFYFDDKPEFNQRVHIFKIYKWNGEPKETEEMKPAWYKFAEIPYSQMWVGDDKWIPYILDNKNIKGEIHFSDGGEKLVSVEIVEE